MIIRNGCRSDRRIVRNRIIIRHEKSDPRSPEGDFPSPPPLQQTLEGDFPSPAGDTLSPADPYFLVRLPLKGETSGDFRGPAGDFRGAEII